MIETDKKNKLKIFYIISILCLSLFIVIKLIIGLNHIANTNVVAIYDDDCLLVGSTLIIQNNNTFIFEAWNDLGINTYIRGEWTKLEDTLQLNGKKCFPKIDAKKEDIIQIQGIEFVDVKMKIKNDSLIYISGESAISNMKRRGF
jgi:hypothetical protein